MWQFKTNSHHNFENRLARIVHDVTKPNGLNECRRPSFGGFQLNPIGHAARTYVHIRALPCISIHWITVIRVKDQFTEGFKWTLKYMSQNLPQNLTKLGPIYAVTKLRSGSRQVCGIRDHIHRLTMPGYPIPSPDLSNQAIRFADLISLHARKAHYANNA